MQRPSQLIQMGSVLVSWRTFPAVVRARGASVKKRDGQGWLPEGRQEGKEWGWPGAARKGKEVARALERPCGNRVVLNPWCWPVRR